MFVTDLSPDQTRAKIGDDGHCFHDDIECVAMDPQCFWYLFHVAAGIFAGCRCMEIAVIPHEECLCLFRCNMFLERNNQHP